MFDNLKMWVDDHLVTTTAMGATLLVCMAGAQWMRPSALEKFMAAVDEGRVEFTVKDESGRLLDMRDNARLRAELDKLAKQNSAVTIQIGWANSPPVCQGMVSAVEMVNVFQGKLVNAEKPNGLKIDIDQLNTVCGRLEIGKSHEAIDPIGPYSTVAANGVVMEQRVVAPKLLRS